MGSNADSLRAVFDGWDGYHLSLVHATAPLTREQLVWRLTPDQRSVGELAEHIALGRIDWFRRMDAPGSAELAAEVPPTGSLVPRQGRRVG